MFEYICIPPEAVFTTISCICNRDINLLYTLIISSGDKFGFISISMIVRFYIGELFNITPVGETLVVLVVVLLLCVVYLL